MNRNFSLSLISAAILAFSSNLAATAEEGTMLLSKSTVISACGELFTIDSNAAGLTAQERATIVQRNLDNALISAKDRSPSAVRVQMANRNPIVTLDNYHIVTADGNSAERNNLTQMELAQKWAESIRICLGDYAAIGKYVSLLTGEYPLKKVVASGKMLKDEIAVAPAEMLFPIDLITPISSETSQVGDRIEAVVSHDVPLRPSYASYLPAGTLVIGGVEDCLPYVPNHYVGKDGFTVKFYEFQTPDGKKIPIDGHIYGSINMPRAISIKPTFAQCCSKGSTVKDLNLVTLRVVPAKGNVVGSWKGDTVEGVLGDTRAERRLRGIGFDTNQKAQGLEFGMPRLTIDRSRGTVVFPQGQHMMLQLAATTVIAVSGKTY